MLNVVVTILSPFSYQYGNKKLYLEAGDSLHFDLDDSSSKQELIFLCRPHSRYEKWVYVDPTHNGVSDFLDEVQGRFDYESPPIEEITVVKPTITTELPYGQEGFPSLEPEMELVPTNLMGEVEVAEMEVPNLADNKRFERQTQLNDISLSDLKKLGKELGITYKSKPQLVHDILIKEFGDDQ